MDATSLTLCGYGPAPGKKLEATLVVSDRGTIDAIRLQLNKGKSLSGVYKCANDSGVVVIEKFQDSRHEVDLTQDVAGCRLVSDGHRSVFDGGTSATSLVMKLLPVEYCRVAFEGGDCSS
ncbi:MAG: hypothetical protein HOW97_30500 [Catenulispora sp.]|nr:hypothetical protein [Catenulispora sp.]